MEKKRFLKISLLVNLLFLFTGCFAFADMTVPYQVSGEMVLGPAEEYLGAGFEFSFFNRSEKIVNNFTVVFYLFDEDGNPPATGKNSFVFKINSAVEPCSYVNSAINLDKYLAYIPDEPYEVDYLYVSCINYADGTTWTDPFGFCVF